MMIHVGIVGAAGYTGGELLRLLIHHPNVNIAFAHSRSQAGSPISSVHNDLFGATTMMFSEKIAHEVDVIFLCLGHGESKQFLAAHKLPAKTKIIDLSQDFRLGATYQENAFVYGLPEVNKSLIAKANFIANPGCFATAIQLAMLPILKHKIALDGISITGITGSTGAGQQLQTSTQHSWRNNNVSAYKTLEHQHIKEIQYQNNIAFGLPFVPWRGDHTRGIFVNITLPYNGAYAEFLDNYIAYYKEHPFTHVCPFDINLKQVVNTNNAFIQLTLVDSTLVIHVAIDNLLKGAAGQAVQNMNIMFGCAEQAGLNLKPIAF